MAEQSRVDVFALLRRDARAGVSGRELQRVHHVTWRTVRQVLSSAWPQLGSVSAVVGRRGWC